MDGWGGEERREGGEVLWGDQDGDGQATEAELVGQVQEWQHVPLGWVRKHQDVYAGGGRHGVERLRKPEGVPVLVLEATFNVKEPGPGFCMKMKSDFLQ